MLTVKLCNTISASMVIVEAKSVRVIRNIIECEHMEDMGSDEYVVDGREYDVAYIMNARGSTLQTVRP